MNPLVLPLCLSLLPLAARAGEPINMTEDEFKAVRHYQIALGDPRVQKMSADKRMKAIAKDAGIPLKTLERAVRRAEAAGDVKALCEANIREAGAAAPFAGRLAKVDVDTTEAHAVAYVQWLNENPGSLEEEASAMAHQAAVACPIASSIQVWAQDRSNPRARVFQALIARSAALRINPDRVKDFAHTRYIKLFEKVRNVAEGDSIDGVASNGGQR
jgi:hypothetical protein